MDGASPNSRATGPTTSLAHVRERAGQSAGAPDRIAAEDLLGGQATIEITLNDQVYTLRRTRNGKLILTK